MRLTAFVVLAVAAGVIPAARAVAGDIPSTLRNYRVTSWAGGDGITLGEVRSLAQDQDGYLWLASDAGLVRFDGFRFSTGEALSVATPLPAVRSRAVFIAHDGSLWVGFTDGRGLYHVDHGDVKGVYLEHQFAGFVNAITEDRTGAIWVGHNEGLYRLVDGRPEMVPLPVTGPARHVWDIHEDRAGTLWVATTGGLFRRAATGGFERSPHDEGLVRAISEDAAGRIWITDEVGGYREAGAAEASHRLEARGMGLSYDRKGNLWVTTIGQGIWQVRDAPGRQGGPVVSRATVQTGLVNDENSVVREDRDGNIWVGSIRGVNRLTPYRIQSLVDMGIVHALAVGNGGTAWAGTTTGLIELAGVTPHSPGTSRVVSTAAIRALDRDARGTLRAATDAGLYEVAGNHLAPVARDGPRLGRITSVVSDRRGVLWVCDEVQGLVRVVDGHVEPVPSASADPSVHPTFLHVDDRDRVWVAFSGGTVGVLDHDGRLRRYGRGDGLSHAIVYAINHDRRGDIWVGGDGGLSRLRDDRFQTLSFLPELTALPVSSVIDDDEGNLWVGFSFFGFVRIGVTDVARALDAPSYHPPYRVFNTSDGAAYPDAYYSGAATKDAKGALWFLTSRGLTILDPRELGHDEAAPAARPRIEIVTANDRRYGLGAAATVLPPRITRLRIDYTVVSLSSPERLRFRYRLDGFDTDWVDGTGPRQALYTNLAPGTYRFRLQAQGHEATWSDADADWSFSIQPMFYETRWFAALCALAAGLLIVAAWQLRMRQVRKDLALVFGERMRLSREIHDTLLQGLYGVALQIDVASHYLPDASSPARACLVRIRRQVEEYISEARRSIWNLRSPALEQRDLVAALRDTADHLTAGRVPFVLTVTGTPRSCSPKIETEVLRIGREAVMNAVRHADARRLDMEIGFEDGLLRLRVADDGRGFIAGDQPDPAAATHYGLLSMKERAADVGGRCSVESTPGAGVQVVAEFPLAG